MLTVKCDEFSGTLPIDFEIYENLNNYFEYVDYELNKILDLKNILGNREISSSQMSGYTHAIFYGYDNKRVSINFNPEQLNMKIYLKFGSAALDNLIYQYELKSKQKITVFEIIQKLHKHLEFRLSRFDIAFDFINENVKTSKIMNEIQNGNLQVFNKRNAKVSVSNYIGSIAGAETIYFNKRSGRSFLRVYDKRKEQIKNNGYQLKTALNCDVWTRFELELKKDYANNLTSLILNVKSENEFNILMAQTFTDCFKFKAIVEIKGADEILDYANFYKDILDVAKEEKKILTSENRSRLTEFEKKYMNLKNNGVMTLFKMMQETYSDAEFNEFIDYFIRDVTDTELKPEHFKIIEEEKTNEKPFFKQ